MACLRSCRTQILVTCLRFRCQEVKCDHTSGADLFATRAAQRRTRSSCATEKLRKGDRILAKSVRWRYTTMGRWCGELPFAKTEGHTAPGTAHSVMPLPLEISAPAVLRHKIGNTAEGVLVGTLWRTAFLELPTQSTDGGAVPEDSFSAPKTFKADPLLHLQLPALHGVVTATMVLFRSILLAGQRAVHERGASHCISPSAMSGTPRPRQRHDRNPPTAPQVVEVPLSPSAPVQVLSESRDLAFLRGAANAALARARLVRGVFR